jgi:hypothetical protein
MMKKYWCWPLYRKLHLKNIYTYYDVDNKKFYYTWELDGEDRKTINELIKMSPLSPSEVELENTSEENINELYWD